MDNYYFLISQGNYVIGTPGVIAASERTIDMNFEELAQNVELQGALNLASYAFARPVWNPPVAYPKTGRDLIEPTAFYLSSFGGSHEEREQKREYLLNNGIVRIFIENDSIKQKVDIAIKS